MGMVMAVNGQIQLSKLGQEIFVVDAVGFVVLKELGPLMVAMVLTGWAGSAFAAEIGTMKLDEQISALETMGIRPESFLVFPKLTAMLISMPVLTVFGNVAGIVGGMLIGVTIMKIPFVAYWTRTIEVLDVTTFLLGTAKSIPSQSWSRWRGATAASTPRTIRRGSGAERRRRWSRRFFSWWSPTCYHGCFIRLSVTETERKAYGKKNGGRKSKSGT